MKITFLGTGSSFPTTRRGVSSLALHVEDGSVWLFDCGEGTQIQLQKVSISRNRINKIFITHLHGDHLFGLPGFLCTLSTQCGSQSVSEKAEPSPSSPVIDIYGPIGLRKFIFSALSLSRSLLLFRYRVHEIVPIDIQYPQDWSVWEVDHSPPSALYPSEIEGKLISPEFDDLGNAKWNILEDDRQIIFAAMIHHRIPSFGFVIQEKDRPGTLLVDRLKKAGVPPGPLYGKLKSGLTITLEDGCLIRPEDYLSPKMEGRTVVICGDTNDASPLLHLVKKCDVLIHECTHDETLRSKAEEFGHSTPSMVASFAQRLKTKVLLLNHFSQRYSDSDCGKEQHDTVDLLLNQIKQSLGQSDMKVICAKDLFVYEAQLPSRPSRIG